MTQSEPVALPPPPLRVYIKASKGETYTFTEDVDLFTWDHLEAYARKAVAWNQRTPAVALSDEQIDEACEGIFGSDYGGVLTVALQRAVARAVLAMATEEGQA